jgi:ABC-2 type transport system permease protein
MRMFWLQLRNELWKLFGKKRTYIGFAMFLLAQGIITLVFRYSHASRGMVRQLEANGYPADYFISSITIATVMLFPISYILLPLYVALIGGDLVAKEAEDGTLRMILSRPISRFRLLVLKWVAGVIFSIALVMALGVFGILFSSVFFPAGGLFVFIPGEMFSIFEFGEGLQRYAAAHGALILKAVTVMGLGLMFSCFNVKPAAATILALSFVFVSFILMQIPFFAELRHWFLTHHLNLWQHLLGDPIPWTTVLESLALLAGFNFSFLIVGATVFQLRDIKS